MRANEFITEGPIQALGNWMQKQSIDADQKNLSASRRKMVPAISKSIRKSLTSQVIKLLKSSKSNPATLNRLAIDIMRKSTSTDIKNNPAKFGKSIITLQSAINADPENVGTSKSVLSAISDIVDTALRLKAETFNRDKDDKDGKDGTNKDPGRNDPGSKDRMQKFTADIFTLDNSPAQPGNEVFVNRHGRWSIWVAIDSTTYEFKKGVNSESNIEALEKLVTTDQLTPTPKRFNYVQDDYYKVGRL